jgi:hypothetical protein
MRILKRYKYNSKIEELHKIPTKLATAEALYKIYRRGFGLVVCVVVPSMLAVLPYARGRRFDSRSRLLPYSVHVKCRTATSIKPHTSIEKAEEK